MLEPGSESFRIRFLPEDRTVGATEIGQRDARRQRRVGTSRSTIRAPASRSNSPTRTNRSRRSTRSARSCRCRCRQGGIGRVLIYKTYKDPRTYMMNGDDIVWVRSLSGYRLGVVLPKGFAFISSNVAAQMSTTADGRLKLAFANPSGQSNPVTIHARKTAAAFTAAAVRRHVLRRHQDALRPRRAGDRPHRRSSRPTATTARATRARLDSLDLPGAAGPEGRSISTRRSRCTPVKEGAPRS